MNSTYAARLGVLFNDTPPQEPTGNGRDLELTTLGVIDAAEKLPIRVYEEFGEEVTKRILRGSGSLVLCVGDRGITVIPETRSILIPIHSGPYAERWVRGPWRGAAANFANSFLTLKVVPNTGKEVTRGSGGVDEEDLENMSTGEILKDSKINLESVLGDDGKTVVDKETYSKVYSLVAAGLQRGLLREDVGKPHQRLAVKEVPDITKLSPREVIFYYQKMYHGPESGTDYTGVGIAEEGSKRGALSAEDAYAMEERGFNAEIIQPKTNLMEGIVPENVSPAKEYVEPILPIINSTIAKFNKKNRGNVYTPVRGDDLVGTLLYKKNGRQRYNGRFGLEDNLTPMILSPDVCVFRGYRGLLEDTLVVAKTERGWKAHLFEQHNGDESLGERIDDWLAVE